MQFLCKVLLLVCAFECISSLLVPPGNTRDIRNVKTQFGAKGDGIHDDTAAIQAAISNTWTFQGGLVYLPPGTYLISDTLIWKDQNGNWTTFIGLFGDSISTTKITLSSSAKGYDTPSSPKAMIYTASGYFGSSPLQQHLKDGSGNEAFRNYIQDLTIDAGSHTGAIGIDHVGNNNAAIKNVNITGAGTTGIALIREYPGPMLITNVTVTGFQIGIDVAQPEYSIALEHVYLNRQSVAGLRNAANLITARAIVSQNPSAPAIVCAHPGELSVIDSVFLGCPSNKVVIVANSSTYLRNISAPDCPNAIVTGQSNGTIALPISEYATNTYSLLYNSSRSLGLPIMETPSFDETDFSEWANVEDYGANGTYLTWGDDTTAIQKALDSGKSVIYFPKGWYFVSRTLNVTGNVRKIIGYYSNIAPVANTFNVSKNPTAFFHIYNTTHPVIFFEFVYVGILETPSTPPAGMIGFFHDTPSDLVLRHCAMPTTGLNSYASTRAAGSLYLEDYVAPQVNLSKPGQKVWARHFNAEADAVRLWNYGAQAWVLGLKIENINTLVINYQNAKTEILGAYIYPVLPTRAGEPAFLNLGGELSITCSYQCVYDLSARYVTLVEEQRNGKTAFFNYTNATQFGYSDIMPLFSSVMTSSPVSTTTNQATNGQSTNGQSTNGQSTNGQSTNEQSTSTQSTIGQSTNGQSTTVQATNGQSTTGQSTNTQTTTNEILASSTSTKVTTQFVLVGLLLFYTSGL